MGFEIERKFLVKAEDNTWRLDTSPIFYRQGYLNSDKNRTVRVRTIGQCSCGKHGLASDRRGFLTVKGCNAGPTRVEFEYEIPYGEAEQLLALRFEPQATGNSLSLGMGPEVCVTLQVWQTEKAEK